MGFLHFQMTQVRYKHLASLFHMWLCFSQHSLLKKEPIFFSSVCFWFLCQISGNWSYVDLLLYSLFYVIYIYMSVFASILLLLLLLYNLIWYQDLWNFPQCCFGLENPLLIKVFWAYTRILTFFCEDFEWSLNKSDMLFVDCFSYTIIFK